MTEVCSAKILDTQLSLPRIGLCEETLPILIICIVTTIVIQGVRHYLWDLTSVKKWEILNIESEKRTFKQVSQIMLIQLGKTILWVFSILLIVNANIYVIIAHMVADIVFSGIFIKYTAKSNDRKVEALTTEDNKKNKIKF